MMKLGLFDLEFRCRELEKNGDPLVKLNKIIPWEDFRDLLNRVHEKERKSDAGRKPYDVILMFKIMILQSLYNLSDDAMEYQIQDRISFMRFLDHNIGESIPDAKTIWLFREHLGQLNLTKKLFEKFNVILGDSGFKAQKGQIVDANIVSVPVQRNSREQNKQIKEGITPKEWNGNMKRQKDADARWTKKNGKRYYGYKNHVGVDVKHKLIRTYEVSDAAVNDSRIFEELLDKENTNKNVFADCAYRSRKNSQILAEHGFRDKVHRASYRHKKITTLERKGNKTKSKTRVRVEHVFGIQLKIAGNLISRVVGCLRNTTKIGLRNLAYNMFRLPKLMPNI
jgi:IS5 family transposase